MSHFESRRTPGLQLQLFPFLKLIRVVPRNFQHPESAFVVFIENMRETSRWMVWVRISPAFEACWSGSCCLLCSLFYFAWLTRCNGDFVFAC